MENNNSKKIAIVSLLVLLLVVGALAYKFMFAGGTNDTNTSNNIENTTDNTSDTKELDNTQKSELDDEEVILSDEEVTIPENSHLNKLYTKLNEYGVALYKKKEYTSYNKMDDVYFISLNEMHKKYNYDISMFVGEDGTVCDVNKSGVYFDIDYKLIDGEVTDGMNPLVLTLIKCSKKEATLDK